MVVKLDLKKAYNTLDWGLLELVLKDFGFPQSFINLVKFSVSESIILILWNGEKLPPPPIYPSRELKQGDPLNPFCLY